LFGFPAVDAHPEELSGGLGVVIEAACAFVFDEFGVEIGRDLCLPFAP
jgi:hypothetical protein